VADLVLKKLLLYRFFFKIWPLAVFLGIVLFTTVTFLFVNSGPYLNNNSTKEVINVTKTFPPLLEYNKQLERIWANQWLTNRGELLLELEDKLKAN
jgi:hypothetical protein